MDLPFRILATKYTDPLLSDSELARRLRIDRSLLRREVARLESQGILAGWTVLAHPAIVHRTPRTFGFDARADPEGLARIALDEPSTAWVATTLDDWIYVGAAEAEGTDAHAESKAALGIDHLDEYTARWPHPAPIGPMELRLVHALLAEPRDTNKSLAAATGLAPKTVARLRPRLLERNAVSIVPRVLAAEGPFYFHLTITASSVQAAEQAAASVGGRVIETYSEPPGAYAFCRADSLPAYHRLLSDVRGHQHVRTVHVTLNRSVNVAVSRQQQWVEAALAEWDGARRTTGPRA